MMNQVYKTLPDDRPITSLVVVEDVDVCPRNYTPVSKTYDQDSDADLWRESGFFGRKCTRYLCISKTEGTQDYVVESVSIINEKQVAPQGYKTIPRTYDSGIKAWRKKQLCYKYSHVSYTQTAVTDIIVLSRSKKAPEEFLLLGEINGMTLCYKTKKTVPANNASLYPSVPYPVSPFPRGQPITSSSNIPQHDYQNLPSNSSGGENGVTNNGGDMLRPLRPAPKPPASSFATISGYHGLEGVPFILNPKFNFINGPEDKPMPKPKTKSQVDEEYSYDFRTERETS